MNLFVDANLSWKLCKLLQNYFSLIKHAQELNPAAPVTDIEIWEVALKNNFLILTNDADFYKLSTSKGFPPKVILLHTGNQKTLVVANLIINKIEEINRFYNNADYGILEIISNK